MNYRVIFEQTETGYTAYVPVLRGCVSKGKSKEDAVDNIKEAMELYIETLRAHNQQVPSEERITIARVPVSA
jgi:predicted RNase H-like HicB family nuclease